MRRTGHDFQDIHVFREFPDGVREQHDRESYPLRAVRVKKGAALSNPDRYSTVRRKPVNPQRGRRG